MPTSSITASTAKKPNFIAAILKPKRLKYIGLVLITIILATLYLYSIRQNYLYTLSLSDHNFGYHDYQNNWRGLTDFLEGKTPFRDYFYEYGWFFLCLQAPGYLLGGKTFLSVIISRELYLPFVGVLLSIWVGKNFLKQWKWVLLFLCFLFLFRVNHDYTSLRHLVAEFSLSFFALYIYKQKRIFLVASGAIAGLSILTSLEYGVALNLAVLIVTGVFCFQERKWGKDYVLSFLIAQIIILIPFGLWLSWAGALRAYWDFTSGFITHFYEYSPCRGESFPRLGMIPTLKATTRLSFFGLPIEWLQKVNYYLVIVVYAATLVWALIKSLREKNKRGSVIVAAYLSAYGLLITGRTLANPCTGYFAYGLLPFFAIATLAVCLLVKFQKNKRRRFKILVFFLVFLGIGWLGISNTNDAVINFFSKKKILWPSSDKTEKIFYAPAGLVLNTQLVQDYKAVTDFIVNNTQGDDPLYVYPWGPYNTLAQRRPANSFTTNYQFLVAGPRFAQRARDELSQTNPPYVIINLYNAGGTARFGATRNDVADFYHYPGQLGPVFSGGGNGVEKYILEHYQAVKVIEDIAIIMQRREVPLPPLVRKFKTVASWPAQTFPLTLEGFSQGQGDTFTVSTSQPALTVTIPQPVPISHLYLAFDVPGNFLARYSSILFLKIFVKEKNLDQWLLMDTPIVLRQPQELLLGFAGREAQIEKIKLNLSSNAGFFWWLKPNFLRLQEIRFLKLQNK